MKKSFIRFWIFILMAALLAGCQASQGNLGAQSGGQVPSSSEMQTRIASNPDLATQIASGGAPGGGPEGFFNTSASVTATPTETAAPTETPEPTATAVSPTAGAVQAAEAYFAALQKGDFAAAAKLVSSFSLTANRLIASDVADALSQQKAAGAAWSDFKVVDNQVFNQNTVLVHVAYQLSMVDSKTGKTTQSSVDEIWPFRLEAYAWRYNWTNIIDFKTLESTATLVNGLTITPLQLTRYTDKIRLTVLAQNGTNTPIVIGGTTNQLLGTFHFGSQVVDAVNTRYILDAWRSYPNVYIDVQGLYTSYPDSVELVRYKSTTASPWFTIDLSD